MKNRHKQTKNTHKKKVQLKIVEGVFVDSLKQRRYTQKSIESAVNRHTVLMQELQKTIGQINEPFHRLKLRIADVIREITEIADSSASSSLSPSKISLPLLKARPVRIENIDELVERMLLGVRKEFSSLKKSKKVEAGDQVIFLNTDGELYTQRNKDPIYALKKNHKMHQLLVALYPTYTATVQLCNATNNVNVGATRKMIHAINRNVRAKLKISHLIQGNSGNGYRINPKYKIRRVQ